MWLHVELQPTGLIANRRPERTGRRASGRASEILRDAATPEAAEQSSGVPFASQLDVRRNDGVTINRNGVTLDQHAGRRREPGPMHPNADLAAEARDEAIGDRSVAVDATPTRAKPPFECWTSRSLAGVHGVALARSELAGEGRHHRALNRPTHLRGTTARRRQLASQADLSEPIPEIPRPGKVRRADRGQRHWIEIGDERRLRPDHDLGARPVQSSARRSQSRLGKEPPIPRAVLHAAEEVEIDVARERAAEYVLD